MGFFRFETFLSAVLCLIAIYDATALNGDFAGFGGQDTRLFGYRTDTAYPVVVFRLLLWLILAAIVASTWKYLTFAILFGVAAYLGTFVVCAFSVLLCALLPEQNVG